MGVEGGSTPRLDLKDAHNEGGGAILGTDDHTAPDARRVFYCFRVQVVMNFYIETPWYYLITMSLL